MFLGDFRVRTAQERVGRSKKFLYRIERFSMIELFKEAFPENFSGKKVDWVRKSGQNARMSQVPSPDLKQLYCVAIDIFSKGGYFI